MSSIKSGDIDRNGKPYNSPSEFGEISNDLLIKNVETDKK